MYLVIVSDFNETWLFPADLEKFSNIKFHQNPSNGGDFFYVDREKYRKTDTQRDMTKLTVAYRNFVHAFKNVQTNKTNKG
jgi:hypothetical protein